jgi:TRAP-type C4-dicarboxylate transport system substrate-binding protein
MLATALAPRPVAADEVVLRFATLAPEGSSWMKLFHLFRTTVETRTAGRVRMKFFTGGVQGDERDVLRKIRLGQLSGAALTGIGLAAIDLEVRALDLARSDEELDVLRAAIGPYLKQRLESRGFVLLGWGDVGPVHFFSNRPVRSLADLQATRTWLWSDDPVSRRMFTALGLSGVPMGVPDVLPGLATGAIDAFFGSPLATLALQWSTHARYMTSLVMLQATGATVVSRVAWERIAPADRAIFLEEAAKLESAVLHQVRSDNQRALATMVARGLVVVPTPPALAEELRRLAEPVALDIGKGFSAELQAKLKELAAKRGTAGHR